MKTKLGWLSFVSTGSLLATLSNKHKSTINKMHKKLSKNGELVHLMNVKGKSQRVVVYKLKHLKKPPRAADVDNKRNTLVFTQTGTQIIQRLNAGECEYCKRTDGYFEVHHKHKLANTHPAIKRVMAAMRRKTMVLCVPCHDMLHAGTLPDMRFLRV
jgi:RNA-directed DNA polymerase